MTARGNDRQDIFRDEAGRIAGVSNGDGSLYYAGASYSDLTNRIQYSPAGAMVQMRLGNGLWNDTRFNSRLQAIQIGLGQTRLTNLESTITPSSTVADKLLLDQCFSGTDTNCSNGVTTNNGNLLQQRIRKQGTPSLDLTQSYSYDVLNRITNASETPGTGTAWSAITYGLDRYGNRWVSTGYKLFPTLTPVSSAEFNAATNRMVSPSSYDAVGNLTNNKVSQTATYDAENRMTSFNSGVGITNYTYDGDGRRISKQLSSGATTYYVYNVLGQLSAEYLTTGPVGGGITYLTWDHLGSTRVTTDSSKAFKSCHDYLPYGEEIDPSYGGRSGFPCYTSTLLDGPTQKFTQKERDTESNLDYFGARYFSGAQGRFTSVDPTRISLVFTNPQSLNRYSYALNNPERCKDENGLWVTWVHNSIIDAAFEGILARSDINALKDASWAIDNPLNGGQEPENAFMHSMFGPKPQGMNDAEFYTSQYSEINRFISNNLWKAKVGLKGGEYSGSVFTYLGYAIHPLADMGSARHVSSDGTPVVWSGGPLETISHVQGEWDASSNWAGFGQSIRLVIAGYLQVFGLPSRFKSAEEWANYAITKAVTSQYTALQFKLAAESRGQYAPRPLDEDAARQCALGNLAACQ